MTKLLPLPAILLASNLAYSADLSDIYQQAIANDAQIAAARATREASEYGVGAARGALLPQATLTYSKTQSDSERTDDSPTSGRTTTENDDDLDSLQIQASQTLFNLNSWYNYKAAISGDDAAALQLKQAEQQLIMRTAQAYFEVLRAQDNLAATQAEEKAVKRSLEQTKQRFDVGLIAITEVHEAQARYDLAYVNLINREASLDISYEALEQLTGQRFDQVTPLSQQVSLEMPQPLNVADWLASGDNLYVGVQIAKANENSVRLQRNATNSNHLPTVSLSATYTDGDQASFTGGDPSEITTTNIAVQLSVPLLAGGSQYSQSKQAASQYAAAQYQLESERRTMTQQIRSLFRQVSTDVLNVKARKQSIVSAQSALEATQTGYKVGTRNIVEVLNAQQTLYSAQSDYANARYDYINNLLNLKFYAGTLNEQDIQLLNDWLQQG